MLSVDVPANAECTSWRGSRRRGSSGACMGRGTERASDGFLSLAYLTNHTLRHHKLL